MVDQVELRTVLSDGNSRLASVSAGCDHLLKHLENTVGDRYAESLEDLEGRHDLLVTGVRDLVYLLQDVVSVINAPHPNNTGEV